MVHHQLVRVNQNVNAFLCGHPNVFVDEKKDKNKLMLVIDRVGT